jgi:hypothetical protein
MPAASPYDYAIIRIVPHVERGECMNVGVILFCPTRRFLDALIHLDRQRLAALAPHLEYDTLRSHLDAIPLICRGGTEAGGFSDMSQSERFQWLVSPRSTIIQPSPLHSGLCVDPQVTLEHLLKRMVLLPQNGKESDE